MSTSQLIMLQYGKAVSCSYTYSIAYRSSKSNYFRTAFDTHFDFLTKIHKAKKSHNECLKVLNQLGTNGSDAPKINIASSELILQNIRRDVGNVKAV